MIYVLIPAYNEASTVGLLLWKVRQVFTSFAREYQLLVVNDGSTDATAETLAPYTRALPLTLLTNRMRQGYAASLERLFRAALERTDRPRRDAAITLQADFTDAPDDLPELIRRLESGADLVMAARTSVPGRGAARVAQRLLPRALRLTLGTPAAAAAAGTLRAYRLGVIEGLLRERDGGPLLEREGRLADVELFVRAARHARRVEVASATGPAAPPQRGSRAMPLGDAWASWRAALALRGVARTSPATPGAPGAPQRKETPEAPRAAAAAAPAGAAEEAPRRRGGRRRRGRRGRGGKHPNQPARPAK